jgi:F0F1-type ATP synthase membrane subunit b/b'
MSKLETVAAKIDKLRDQLEALEEQYQQLRLETLRKVEVVKNGATITLKYNGREIKAKKNAYGRYKVWEGDKVLNRDYTWGIHDLRLALATGQF